MTDSNEKRLLLGWLSVSGGTATGSRTGVALIALWLTGITMATGCAPTPYPQRARAMVPRPQPTLTIPSSPRPAPARTEWQPEAKARDWHYIVIHHTASSGGSVESIHEAHLGRGWEGIGYHFLIGNGSGMGDGQIEPTFRWRQQMHGAHAGKDEYNQHGIGVCLVGNFEESDPSPAQLAAVKQLIATLKAEYSLASSQVIAHKDVKATACPGKNFPLGQVSRSSLSSGILSVSYLTQHHSGRRRVSISNTPTSNTPTNGSQVVLADWRSTQ